MNEVATNANNYQLIADQWIASKQLLTLKVLGEPDSHITMLMQQHNGELVLDTPPGNLVTPDVSAAISLMAPGQPHRLNCRFIEPTLGGWVVQIAERQSVASRRMGPRVRVPLKRGPSIAFKTEREQIISCRITDLSANGFAGEIRGEQLGLVHAGARFTSAFIQLDDHQGLKVGIYVIRAKLAKRPTRTQISAELFGLSLDDKLLLNHYVQTLHHQEQYPTTTTGATTSAGAVPAWAPLATPIALPTSQPSSQDPSQGVA